MAVALKLLRPHSVAFAWVAGAAAVVVVAWSMTGQVYAAEGERTLLRADRPQPARSRTTGSRRRPSGGSVVVLGQQISDPTGIWLTEFFNPSVRKMWSLDGTAQNGRRARS